MRYHQVGATDIKVSEIGFGCWTMGGPNWALEDGQPIGWAPVDPDEITRGIRIGLDAGVNHFDNADIYGNGRAERMLRDCLRTLGVARDDLVIATKVGWFQGTAPHRFHPFHIRRQCEQSLMNLGIETIDIYYFHNAMFASSGEGNIEDAAGEMRRLVEEGKVRAVGQSAYTPEDFARCIPVVRPDVLQSRANMLFDLMIRPGGQVPALMAEHGCSFVGFGPLGQGLLLDKFSADLPPTFEEGDVRRRDDAFRVESLRELQPKLQALKERFGDSTEDLASAACRFVAAHAGVCSVIPGFRNERQASCNVQGASHEPMSEEDVQFCRDQFH